MRFVYTSQMCEWMKSNYLLRLPELTFSFNAQFSTNRSSEAINGLRKRLGLKTGRTGAFKKGNVPVNAGTVGMMRANAGSFRKGSAPPNHAPIGTHRINAEGYRDVKSAEPNVWKQLHHINWEKLYGPIPKGMVLRFLDGDRLNCDPENLALVSRAEHIHLTRRGFDQLPAEVKSAGLNTFKLECLIFERSRSGIRGTEQ